MTIDTKKFQEYLEHSFLWSFIYPYLDKSTKAFDTNAFLADAKEFINKDEATMLLEVIGNCAFPMEDDLNKYDTKIMQYLRETAQG